MVGTEDRGLRGLYRVSLVVDGRGRAGEVVDLIDLSPIGVDDIVAHQLEVGLANQMPYILLGTTVEVVKADDVVALVDEALTKMRTNKAGSTSNQNSFHI